MNVSLIKNGRLGEKSLTLPEKVDEFFLTSACCSGRRILGGKKLRWCFSYRQERLI